MAFGLFVLCLLLDYIFWQLNFTILFILAFDGTILLLYKLCGPRWVYSQLWRLSGKFWYLTSLILAHPYIFATFIVFLFVGSVLLPVHKYCRYRERAQRKKTIGDIILSLSVRLANIEQNQNNILQLLGRLANIEQNQNNILQLLRRHAP